jgi:hypothetical protein
MKHSPHDIIYGGFYSPPLMECGERGRWQGPLIKLAAQIAKCFHLAPTFTNLSQEQLNHFDQSSVDIGIGVFETQSRKMLGDFSQPIFQVGLQGLSLKNYAASDLNDLSKDNLRFGVKEGEIGHDFLIGKYGSNWISRYCHIIPDTSPLDSWSLLESRECDVILCDTLTLTSYREEIAEPSWFTFTRPIAKISACFLIHRASPLSVNDINHWLALHSNTEAYDNFIASVRENKTPLIVVQWCQITKGPSKA